ncbi:uncharacterized protein C5L36_0E03470 [Pichia kudriavzevii]|uniref:Nudix hydrolase domain-containing protein n=2 Tax=Pichia kudriavzevii TaxID=4909 RepID=A0A2U9RBR0_PICKU|nr:uncharacterized protein C5L36_0E03470 [Pichia kudriavzevii]AWU78289.1 hypothetical protein C5L36_0E03470 [Pichia kudriavzevii]
MLRYLRCCVRTMSNTREQYKDAAKLLDPASTVAKITKRTKLENENAKFVNLEKLEYVSPLGKQGVWEIATRTTKPKGSLVDAVIIVPILKYPNGDKKLVFVRQFRPPCNGVVVEFPAGLVDPNDSIETCALRELKEETGYVGVIRKKTGVVWSDPGLVDANCSMVWVDVDMSLKENKTPVPHWMDNECIEVVDVPLNELEGKIDEWTKQGYLIDGRVQTLVIGMAMANE